MPRKIALAGGALLALMLPASASAAAAHGRPDPSHRGTGHDVRVLQDFLTRAGIPTPVTGYYGKVTRGHVRSFERQHGLPADGVLTSRRRRAGRSRRGLRRRRPRELQSAAVASAPSAAGAA